MVGDLPYLESLDSGSNYRFGDKLLESNSPKSLLDLTHLVTTTLDNAGEIIPLGNPIYTLPGEDLEFSVDSLIRVLAQEVPLYSRQRLYIYAFYSQFSTLYNNFQTFAKKGYTGNYIGRLPTYNPSNMRLQVGDDSLGQKPIQVGSIGDYSGLPQGFNSFDKLNINCLNSMMNLRVLRDYFINKDLHVNDRVLFPDDDTRFRLNDSGQLLSALDAGKKVIFDITGSFSNENKLGLDYGTLDSVDDVISFSPDSEGDYLVFSRMYHTYPSDRFTSAKPFMTRGDEPLLSFDVNFGVDQNAYTTIRAGSPGAQGVSSLSKAFLNNVQVNVGGTSRDIKRLGATVGPADSVNEGSTSLGLNMALISTGQSGAGTPDSYRNQLVLRGSDLASMIEQSTFSFGLNAIRELAIKQTELEKMARTDGTYSQFGITFFGEKPKHAEDYRPTYIGGTVINLQFSEVLQTSAGTQDSPLGNYAGHGIGSNGNDSGFLGQIHSDDYGMVQLYACVMPDIYYFQGINKQWTMSTQADLYLPERAKLSMVPILNHEIYALSDNETELKDLFAYQNIFDEYRYMENSIHGKIADMNSLSFAPYTQARVFSDTPKWSSEFVTANNVRKDYLSAPSEVAYTAQFKINVKAVRPVPYKPVPASII